jgi:GDP-4-dehydro-6-deoxy-D-mannose reductase
MKAFVTGASGFIGGHLSAELTRDGWEVIKGRRGGGACGAEWMLADLRDAAPDVLFHMAGLTHAKEAAQFYEANVALSARLLDAAASLSRPPVVVLAGSAAEYGWVPPQAMPVNEAQFCRPVTDYAISKHAQTQMALARAAAGSRVIVARIWNPVGPEMSRQLALGAFAAEIAAMPVAGGALHVGNLDVARDFIDVREAARLLVARRPEAFGQVVNVCSGRSWKLRALVDRMIALTGRPVALVADPSRMRQREPAALYGDATRLRQFGLEPAPPDFDAILPALLGNARPA